MLAVLMCYWRGCLMLVQEVYIKEAEGGGREEMWLYNRETEGRRGGF
jgi:hypothetical protein